MINTLWLAYALEAVRQRINLKSGLGHRGRPSPGVCLCRSICGSWTFGGNSRLKASRAVPQRKSQAENGAELYTILGTTSSRIPSTGCPALYKIPTNGWGRRSDSAPWWNATGSASEQQHSGSKKAHAKGKATLAPLVCEHEARGTLSTYPVSMLSSRHAGWCPRWASTPRFGTAAPRKILRVKGMWSRILELYSMDSPTIFHNKSADLGQCHLLK